MTDTLNVLIDTYNIPALTALLLGVLTSVSPCPLATNIAAIAYLSKESRSSPWRTFLHGLSYTLGRVASYTAVALLLLSGFSAFRLSALFQGWGELLLGPVLILIGLIMLGVVRWPGGGKSVRMQRLQAWLSSQGFLGAFLLGALFALAFCPYSAALFFGALIPMTMQAGTGFFLPPLYAIGTGLPVILFALLLAISVQAAGRALRAVQRVEKFVRIFVAVLFLGIGAYFIARSIPPLSFLFAS